MPYDDSWRRIGLAILARFELERILFLSRRDHGLSEEVQRAQFAMWNTASASTERDSRLCCLRGTLQACGTIQSLAKKAPCLLQWQRIGRADGWAAWSAVKAAAPVIRDLAVARAVDIVGVNDRAAFLSIIVEAGYGGGTCGSDLLSSLCKAFSHVFGHMVGDGAAFESNNSITRNRTRSRKPKSCQCYLCSQQELGTVAGWSGVQSPYTSPDVSWAFETTDFSFQSMPMCYFVTSTN